MTEDGGVLTGLGLVGSQVLLQKVGGGQIVVIEEQDHLASGKQEGEVLGSAATGVLDMHPGERQPRGELLQHRGRLGVRRPVVDHYHLEVGDR
jgi:hypothetical protein